MHRRNFLSIPRTLFRIVFELPLKRASKTFTIYAAFFAIAVFAISHWAFAKERSISDPFEDVLDNLGDGGLTLTIKDGGTSRWVGRNTAGEAIPGSEFSSGETATTDKRPLIS